MRTRREAAKFRLDEASVGARSILGGDFGPSRETIRRYEAGLTPEDRADPIIVMALAELYGVSLDELSPHLAEQVTGSISKLVARQVRRMKGRERELHDRLEQLEDMEEAGRSA
jgi:hypothetical protein